MSHRSIFSDAEFALLAREMKARTGQTLAREFGAAIETRLMSPQRRENFATVGELIAQARTDARYWNAIIEALIVHETRFFRERALFATLRNDILPRLMEARARPLKAWSAGCSTGQEAYSLALLLEELRAQGWIGGEVLGTDCSDRLLEKAHAGVYTQFEVQRGLPIRTLIANFEKSGDLWRIADRLRALTRFEKHNLLDDPRTLDGPFDVIVCCNVLLPLDAEARATVLDNLSAVLNPGGVIVANEADVFEDAMGYAPTGAVPGLFVRDVRHRVAAA
jgi:chemotaxis protein methyltransferase CheR